VAVGAISNACEEPISGTELSARSNSPAFPTAMIRDRGAIAAIAFWSNTRLRAAGATATSPPLRTERAGRAAMGILSGVNLRIWSLDAIRKTENGGQA
jgi:hypothetical protein